MKHFIFTLTMLFALPLLSNNIDNYSSSLSGTWIDRYDDEKIEIREYGSRIEVKRRGLFRKTRTFYRVGPNRYSDYDNDQIEIQSSSKLIWKNRKNRQYKSYYRASYNRDRYSDRYNNYGNRRYEDYNNRRNPGYENRGQSNRRDNDRYYGNNSFSRDRFDGSWTCPAGRRNISIQAYGNGFKVKRWDSDRWYTFERDPYENNVYRCENGERYIYRDNDMIWYGSNGRDNIRFSRK